MDPHVLHYISYGMFVVSSNKGKLLNGQIANTVFQITSEPVTIAVSINKNNLTHEFIDDASRFCVSILKEDTPLVFIGKFGFKSGRETNKFKDTKFELLDSGCPAVLENTLGYLEAKVINRFDCITHTLFLAEVTDSKFLTEAKPLTYEDYHQVKRGSTPASAPTFIKDEEIKKQEVGLEKYVCTVCGYIYDPALGDPDGGIAPGTPFEKIPDSWVCPVCGASKDSFEKVK
jgi:rubredoxin/flavin reductase (DIM6/NTAB) family NADH-FMN oxidoreductase RutF